MRRMATGSMQLLPGEGRGSSGTDLQNWTPVFAGEHYRVQSSISIVTQPNA